MRYCAVMLGKSVSGSCEFQTRKDLLTFSPQKEYGFIKGLTLTDFPNTSGRVCCLNDEITFKMYEYIPDYTRISFLNPEESGLFQEQVQTLQAMFPDDFPREIRAYWDEEEQRQEAQRMANGCVVRSDYRTMKLEDYFGGFQHPSVLETIEDYVIERSGIPFGYVGHEYRTYESDAFLEAYLEEYPEELENLLIWLCSHPARHFMDSYEGICDLEQQPLGFFADNE